MNNLYFVLDVSKTTFACAIKLANKVILFALPLIYTEYKTEE